MEKCADGRDLNCFKFKVCFKYTAKPKTFNATPKLRYKLTAEKDESGPPRVEFKKKSGKGTFKKQIHEAISGFHIFIESKVTTLV